MHHDEHFLDRTVSRLSLPAMERSMVLYNDSQLTRFILELAKLPEDDAPVAMCGEARLMLKVEIDKAAETVRITKEIGKTEADVLKLTAKLEKPGYTDKAPAHLVAKDQAQLAELSDKLGKLKVQLAKLA